MSAIENDSALRTGVSPITQEVVNAGLRWVVREMRTTLIRTSYSPILYESHDFSCCIAAPSGQIVAMHVDVPLHIFPIVFSTGHLLEKFEGDVRDGDIYLTNDPWIGGGHLNDVSFIKPIFVNGQIECLAVARAHHGDVGGMHPGSASPASTSVHHEGIRFPMVRVVRDEVIDHTLLDVWLSNVRQPFQTEGVAYAQVAVLQLADRRIQDIYRRFGAEVVAACLDTNLEAGRSRLAERIEALPDGDYFYEDYLENSGASGENAKPIYLRPKMSIAGERLTIDFSDSSEMRAGVGNASLADTWCGAFTVLETLFDHGQVTTTGGMSQFDIETVPGTVVDGEYPSPVAGFVDVMKGPVEGSTVGLLSQAMPDEVCPPIGSSCNQMFFSGPSNPFMDGDPWFIFEFSFSGWPAVRTKDGSIASPGWDMGDIPMHWPVERVELLNPLRIVSSDLNADSGGPGLRRGGVGLKRAWNVLAPAQLTFLSCDGILPRPGMDTGYGGALNELRVYRDGVEVKVSETPLKVPAFQCQPGDLVVVFVAGGGGYGDPLERPAELVLQDVHDGYVTLLGAREDYGVCVEGDAVDVEATAALRAELRAGRSQLTIVGSAAEEFDADGRRLARVSAATAARLGLEDGAVAEYALPRSAGLRAWIAVDDRVPDDCVGVGKMGGKIIRLAVGEQVALRSPWSYASRRPRVEPVEEILGLSKLLEESEVR